jgi:hypothetical protein
MERARKRKREDQNIQHITPMHGRVHPERPPNLWHGFMELSHDFLEGITGLFGFLMGFEAIATFPKKSIKLTLAR